MASGRKTGGRKKGVPNKLNSVARSAFLATFGKLEAELEGWLRKTADGMQRPVMVKGEPLLDEKTKRPVTYTDGADPAKAADLLIRMAEYHFPKLGRTELTGKDGAPVPVSITINGVVKRERERVESPANAGRVPRV